MQLILFAHNIRSLWNVGSFFRTADCFGVQKIVLSGYTGTPPRREISKTAIGAEEWIPWEYAQDPIATLQQIQKEGFHIVALEQTDNAVPLAEFQPSEKTCLVVGNEVQGVADDMLELCENAVHIPMYGNKESLNVSVATGIALYGLRLANESS